MSHDDERTTTSRTARAARGTSDEVEDISGSPSTIFLIDSQERDRPIVVCPQGFTPLKPSANDRIAIDGKQNSSDFFMVKPICSEEERVQCLQVMNVDVYITC